MEVARLTQKAVNKAARIIKNGGVVIFPTDTVYGFLADTANKKAVEKIFKLKKRSRQKPLPVFVRDFKMAKELAVIDKNQEKILKRYWPGKYTFVLKLKPAENRSPLLTENGSPLSLVIGKDDTIALRIPKYKFLNNLLKKINKPLVQTSVNISSQPPLIKINDILEKFGRTGLPILIIDAGNLPKRKPSVIIDLTKDKNKILRK